MQILSPIIFVAIGIAILLFLSWFLYNLAWGDYLKLFRWVKYSVIVSTFIAFLLWILKVAISQKLDFKDLTFGAVVLCLVFDLIDFGVIMALKNKNFRKRLKYESFLSSRLMLLALFSLIILPALIIVDTYFLITSII